MVGQGWEGKALNAKLKRTKEKGFGREIYTLRRILKQQIVDGMMLGPAAQETL